MIINGDVILGGIAAFVLYSWLLYNRGYRKGSDDAATIILDRMEEVLNVSEEDKEYRRKMQGGK